MDVSDPEAVEAFVGEVLAADGRVDILVNDAGGVLGQVGRPLEEVTPAEWKAIFEVNADGAFWFSQAVAPAMKAAGRGRIINISSGAGLGVSLTGIQAYASAKAAQIGLTRQLAHELGPWGITVNNIAPGFVRSNPTTERQWQSYGEEGQRALVESIALKRLGTPRGHRPRRPVLRLGRGRVDHRTGAVDRRREVMALEDVLAHLRSRHDEVLEALIEFASIPSVGADPARAARHA